MKFDNANKRFPSCEEPLVFANNIWLCKQNLKINKQNFMDELNFFADFAMILQKRREKSKMLEEECADLVNRIPSLKTNLPMTDDEIYRYEAFRKHAHDDERMDAKASLSFLDRQKIQRYVERMKEERPGFSKLTEDRDAS